MQDNSLGVSFMVLVIWALAFVGIVAIAQAIVEIAGLCIGRCA